MTDADLRMTLTLETEIAAEVSAVLAEGSWSALKMVWHVKLPPVYQEEARVTWKTESLRPAVRGIDFFLVRGLTDTAQCVWIAVTSERTRY